MKERTFKKDSEIEKVIQEKCPRCGRETRQKILASIEEKYIEEDGGYLIYGCDNDYQIIQCQGCENIIFRRTHENSEDMVHYETPWGFEEEYVKTVDLYPDPRNSRPVMRRVGDLPISIERVYRESLKCLNYDARILAGVGIRAIVETVCQDQGAEGKNLKEKIDFMVGQGVLTQDGAGILHSLRNMGNASVHEMQAHSKAQLMLAFDVIDHLLLGVYILPEDVKLNFFKKGQS